MPRDLAVEWAELLDAFYAVFSVNMRDLGTPVYPKRFFAAVRKAPAGERVLREVADMVSKQVRLVTTGEDTEVDKTVVERLAEPITHMLRNAIDHGLETPEERVAAGKPATGRIRLSALQAGGEVLITITDDGRGIDLDAVRGAVVKRGLGKAGSGSFVFHKAGAAPAEARDGVRDPARQARGRTVVIQKNWQELIKPNKLQVTTGDDPKRVATVVASGNVLFALNSDQLQPAGRSHLGEAVGDDVGRQRLLGSPDEGFDRGDRERRVVALVGGVALVEAAARDPFMLEAFGQGAELGLAMLPVVERRLQGGRRGARGPPQAWSRRPDHGREDRPVRDERGGPRAAAGRRHDPP